MLIEKQKSKNNYLVPKISDFLNFLNFTFKNATCDGPNCEKFLQLINPATHRIGCATGICGDAQLVCSYHPPLTNESLQNPFYTYFDSPGENCLSCHRNDSCAFLNSTGFVDFIEEHKNYDDYEHTAYGLLDKDDAYEYDYYEEAEDYNLVDQLEEAAGLCHKVEYDMCADGRNICNVEGTISCEMNEDKTDVVCFCKEGYDPQSFCAPNKVITTTVEPTKPAPSVNIQNMINSLKTLAKTVTNVCYGEDERPSLGSILEKYCFGSDADGIAPLRYLGTSPCDSSEEVWITSENKIHNTDKTKFWKVDDDGKVYIRSIGWDLYLVSMKKAHFCT